MASVDGRLHVCAVEGDQGQIERQIYDPFDTNPYGAGWTDLELHIGSETGAFVDVGCAGVFNPARGVEELHVCGVTHDGRLWHSMESPRGTFSPFGDVSAQSGDVGQFERVACAGNASQLHLVGLTVDHRPWYTARNAAGGWRPFENVHDQTRPLPPLLGPTPPPLPGNNYRDVAIGFCNAEVPPDGNRDVAQLNIVLTGQGDQIWHTIRATNPVWWGADGTYRNWRPMQDLGPVINRGSLSPVPPTTIPRLWGGFSVGYRPIPPY